LKTEQRRKGQEIDEPIEAGAFIRIGAGAFMLDRSESGERRGELLAIPPEL